ncbi:response regulator transcription factor [Pedobacter sp. HDW13]|uniref:LytR/AlgR family response regulator transcription factor n=1 Tax=Pedobacter sp. HDW13 TaxID=2714940 RepID=UPI001409F946|nr:LytTR family DNA-binding domain-containing protein [Pedobacter sp. HDW13]QIL40270.1 response regulator transcription factor [Pedobacter sp. HDW13]
MKLSCIILDGELFASQQLAKYLAKMPIIGKVKIYINPHLAIVDIIKSEIKIDILFIDLETPNTAGIDLIKKIRDRVNFIVLVSSHLKVAVEGYNLKVDHFLLKPFNFEASRRIIGLLSEKIISETPSINIKQEKEYTRIPIDDIIAVEAALNYVKIHTKYRVFIIYNSMRRTENELSPYVDLIRISKSFIISKSHIRKIVGRQIFLENEIKVTIGSTYKMSLTRILKDLPTFQKD